VAGEVGRVEADAGRVRFYDVGDAAIGESRRLYAIGLPYRSKNRPVCNAGNSQPRFEGGDRISHGAARYRDDVAASFLIRLAAPNPVGSANPASLWAYRIAAMRLPMLEGRQPRSASQARNAATASADAGKARVRATIRGIRRSIGAAPVKKAPATVERISMMVPIADDRLATIRDRALLLLGFAGACIILII
jgi:hypothetical protein